MSSYKSYIWYTDFNLHGKFAMVKADIHHVHIWYSEQQISCRFSHDPLGPYPIKSRVRIKLPYGNS